jgi:hypothetical protein
LVGASDVGRVCVGFSSISLSLRLSLSLSLYVMSDQSGLNSSRHKRQRGGRQTNTGGKWLSPIHFYPSNGSGHGWIVIFLYIKDSIGNFIKLKNKIDMYDVSFKHVRNTFFFY